MSDKEARLLSVGETAERLNVSPRTVYRLAESGELPVLRIGGSLRVDPNELRSYIYQETPVITEGKAQ